MIEAIGGEDQLFELLPFVNDREELLEQVTEVFLWLSISLDDPDPNSIGDRKTSKRNLCKLATKLNAVREAIEELQGYSRHLLVRKASSSYGQSDWMTTGEREITKFVESLEHYETWVREIRVMHNSSGGQPSKPEADEAVFGLVEIWENHTGKRPKISTDSASGQKHGSFLTFCEIVIHPIYKMRSLNPPSIQSLVQKILYPPDKEQ